MHKLHFLFHNYPSQKKKKKKFQETCRAKKKKKEKKTPDILKNLMWPLLFLRMTSFKWSFSNSTVLPSSSGTVAGLHLTKRISGRHCSCSSKITQRRYKVSQHRTPNLHSLPFTLQRFHAVTGAVPSQGRGSGQKTITRY